MGSGPGTVLVWDLPSGAIRWHLGGLPCYARGIDFAPDGRLLTVTLNPRPTTLSGRELKLWDLTSGRELRPGASDSGRGSAFGPAGDGLQQLLPASLTLLLDGRQALDQDRMKIFLACLGPG